MPARWKGDEDSDQPPSDESAEGHGFKRLASDEDEEAAGHAARSGRASDEDEEAEGHAG